MKKIIVIPDSFKGSMSSTLVTDKKQLKMLEGWMAIHEDELAANWRMLSNGDGYFKIDPLR